jgi:hypothetical protein
MGADDDSIAEADTAALPFALARKDRRDKTVKQPRQMLGAIGVPDSPPPADRLRAFADLIVTAWPAGV